MKIEHAIVLSVGLLCCDTERSVGRSRNAIVEAAEPALSFDLPDGAVVIDPPPPGLAWAVQIPVEEPVAPVQAPADEDRDGFTADQELDDHDPNNRPPQRELLCNGRDEDGDGLDNCPPDVDRDGAHAGIDCDDLDPAVGPQAREIRCDGADQNCDGHDLCDRDGDGVVDWDDGAPDDPAAGAHVGEASAEWE